MSFYSTLFAQGFAATDRFDSLQLALKQSVHDTTKIRLYHQIAGEIPQNKPKLALAYEDSSLLVAKRLKHPEYIAVTLTNIGAIYRRMSENEKACSYFIQAFKSSPSSSKWLTRTYLEAGIALLHLTYIDSALHTLQSGLGLVKKHPDAYMEASLYNAMGNVKREQNKYEEALALYIKAIKLFEREKNLHGLTQALSNAGNIHNLMGNIKKAMDYAKQSLETAKAANVKSSIAYSYRLLGRIYRKQGKPDEALDAYRNATALYREILAKRDLGETQLGIGNIYFDKGNYREAFNQYTQALAVVKSIPDTLNMTYLYVAAGIALIYTKEFPKAKTYLDSGIVVATRKNLAALRMDAYQALSEIYETEGNYKQGYFYYKKFIAVKDSVTQVQNRKEAQEIEARYQSEKKDGAIKILNAENKLKATQQKFLLLFLGMVIVLTIVLYSRYRVKQHANKKLTELDQIKSRFFTNVSHEFRTPLSLIIGPLEEKLSVTQDQDEKDALLLMHRNAKRLQNLTNQVLDLSRIEAGSMELHLEEADLPKLLRYIGSSFTSLAERKGISYQQEIFDQYFMGCFDRDKLEKIINNLLSNAFKFTPAGGVVCMKATLENGILLVEVRDSGIGIPDEKIGQIFNRFFQADDSITRASEGSGIGLSLSKELADLHRGKLTVTSREGAGSIFTLSLPVTRGAYPNLSVKEQSKEVETLFYHDAPSHESSYIDEDESKPLILLAEDNEDMQKFIYDLLKARFRVIGVSNGLEALKRSQETVPDLVISDWMMPGMDGRTLCKNLKSSDTTCHIPVLMLTARADRTSKLEGLETGADDYLIKPFDTNELTVRIHNLIEQRKKLRQVFSSEFTLKPQQITLPSRDAVFLSKILSLLEEKYASPDFSVEELSQAVNMSRMQLHRKIRALTDQSPGEILRKFRLDRAKQMLSVAGIQVSEVCFKVGYNNVSNFSKAFREHSGLTPTEYIDSVTTVR